MLPISFFLEFVVFLDLIFPVIAASFIIVAQKLLATTPLLFCIVLNSAVCSIDNATKTSLMLVNYVVVCAVNIDVTTLAVCQIPGYLYINRGRYVPASVCRRPFRDSRALNYFKYITTYSIVLCMRTGSICACALGMRIHYLL